MTITKKVMDRVVQYEQKQVSWWLLITVGIIGIALFLFLIISFVAIKKINAYGSWDLLTLFFEDPEIIRDFWQDTLTTFWIEMPKQDFFILLLVVTLFIVWFVWTANKRRVMQKKLQILAKYKKSATIKPMLKIVLPIVFITLVLALVFLMPNESKTDTVIEVVKPTIAATTKLPEMHLVITSPATGTTIHTPVTTIHGTTVPSAEVFVNDKEEKADARGNFAIELLLDEGENYILITANDSQGNYKEAELTLTYETN